MDILRQLTCKVKVTNVVDIDAEKMRLHLGAVGIAFGYSNSVGFAVFC